MKNKKAIVSLIIINIILICIILNLTSGKGSIIKERQTIKEMTSSTLETNLNAQITALNIEHQDYQNKIQACKTKIATALTNEGVETSDQILLDEMAEKIPQILQARTSDADATPADIAEGKTAYVNGELITGTLGLSALNIDLNKCVNQTWSGNKNTTKTITVEGTPILIITGGCYDLDNSGGSRSRNVAGIYDATQEAGTGDHKVTDIDFTTNTVTLKGTGSYTGYYRTYVFYK